MKLRNVNKSFGDSVIYKNFNLELEPNKITVILGESGSGKTTLLNMIAGVTDFSGEIIDKIQPISVVFQQDLLVPNLTVKENILLFSPNADIENILMQADLEGKSNEYVKNLSAGMARRVAIMRALYFPSKLLLMDEPFINLDIALKFSLIDVIKKNIKDNERTALIVTHDVKEAVMLADRICVLSNGKVVYDNNCVDENTEKELYDFMVNLKNLNKTKTEI